MSRHSGLRITLNSPILNSALKDGSRLNAIIPPVSTNSTIATLRRFRQNPITPINLINYQTLSIEMVAFIWLMMQTDSNVIIAGNTGSGKTTTLNSIFSFVPENERIIITEDTTEINIPHKHKIQLKTDHASNTDMNALIKSTLRMRPDRLIVGEIRDKNELSAFTDTILAGQGKGSFATFHALSTNDAIQRLYKLGMQEQDLNALDIILLQRRWTQFDKKTNKPLEIRKIINISEIQNNQIRDIFKYDFKEKKWVFATPKKLKDKIELVYDADFNNVFELKKAQIRKLINQDLNIDEFVKIVSKNNYSDKFD
jgi:Flp pilus assembly CpaF family ATPase